MSPLQAEHQGAAAVTQALPVGDPKSQSPKRLLTQEWTCLVLSLDGARRERLRSMVQFSGWRPLPCANIAEAIQHDERWRTQFALVDLASDKEGMRESVFRLVERLSDRPDPLVMVCDSEPSVEAELWARKLGVWLYLPEPEIGEELTELCREAMRISRSRTNEVATAADA